MASNSIVTLTVEDSSFNAKIKAASKAFADFGSNVASAGADAFQKFASGATTAKVAFQGFNTVLKANALMFVATLAVQVGQAIGEMIGDWIKGADDAEAAQRRLNEELERTEYLIKEIDHQAKFNERIARAKGASTTEILQQRKKDAELQLDMASSQLASVARNKYATPEEEEKAKKLVAAAQERLRNAIEDLKVDETARKHHTGEYAIRGGGGRSSGGSKTELTEMQQNQQTINTLTQEYVRISDNANEETRQRQEEIRKEIQLLEQRNNLLNLYAQQAQGKLQGGDVQTTGLGSGSMWGSFKDIKIDGLGEETMEKVRKGMEKMNDTAKESKNSFQGAAAAVSAMGNALSSIKDPGVQIMSMIGQAIASIALGFAQASAKEGKGGIWYWIAATAAGLATMVATISSIHSATGYAQGGIVKGNSYSGDNIYGGEGMINAGELVLTKSMQGNLASQLQGNGMQNMNIVGRIKGTDIILSIDRSLKLEGKQLLTWGR